MPLGYPKQGNEETSQNAHSTGQSLPTVALAEFSGF
jgi:hypothetical protein